MSMVRLKEKPRLVMKFMTASSICTFSPTSFWEVAFIAAEHSSNASKSPRTSQLFMLRAVD